MKRRRINPAPDFVGYKGPAGWEAKAQEVIGSPWIFATEIGEMQNKKTQMIIRDAGLAMARAVIERGTPSERLDAVEGWQANAIRPRSKAFVSARAANRVFVDTCNLLAREILKMARSNTSPTPN